MPESDKRLLDYFIKHTDRQFLALKNEMGQQHKGLSKQLRQLRRFGMIAVILCVALSPKGEKIMELFPKLLEVASAVAGVR